MKTPVSPTLLLGALAVTPLAQTAVSGGPGGPGSLPTDIPGLARFSIQVLEVPPVRQGEPAVLAFEVDGGVFTLDLEPHSVRSDDFQLVEFRDGVRIDHPTPPVTTYKGVMHDARGQRMDGVDVRASEGIHGWSVNIAMTDGDYVVVEPLVKLVPDSVEGLHVIYRASDETGDSEPRTCGVESGLVPTLGSDDNELPIFGGGTRTRDGASDDTPGMAALTGNEICEISFDCDVEYYQQNGSDVLETTRDVENIINNCERAYERDVDITYEITQIVVRTGGLGSDPYSTTSAGGMLTEFRNEWNANFLSVRHDISHMMTGKDLDGSTIGVANLSVICSTSSDVGLSQSMFSPFINPRTGLTAHELGHNWSAFHCDGDATCNIMCSGLGGCDGLGSPPEFASSAVSRITSHRNSRSCLSDEPDFLAAPLFEVFDSTTFNTDVWVYRDQLAIRDDQGDNAPTEPNVMKMNAVGTEQGEQDDIRTHFIDLSAETQGTLSLSFFTQHQGVESGESLFIEYRNESNRKWKELVTVTSDGIDQTDFTFHTALLPNNAYHDRFRVRFHTDSSQTNDSWFVDNVVISDGPNLAQEELIAGATFDTVAYGAGPGEVVAFGVSLAATTGTGFTLFGGAVTLDILPPLAILGFDVADGSGVAEILDVPLPSDFPLIPVHTQAVNLRGPSNSLSTKSNPVTHVVQ